MSGTGLPDYTVIRITGGVLKGEVLVRDGDWWYPPGCETWSLRDTPYRPPPSRIKFASLYETTVDTLEYEVLSRPVTTPPAPTD